ncbi:IQ domain-containing protein IQM1-like [Dendrobium catenatum]|uniref:IQ domain-containing protein IQM1-like n=1 Tax=Dendrobium catenatum TaxID=906689 RepID=UPI00109F336A|nr:IQ domain-containing protein IQM1-like [Dendrobium catenatum]
MVSSEAGCFVVLLLPELLCSFLCLHPFLLQQVLVNDYRTRRNLADCAVEVEELWWRALDFASLKRSSISFFNEEKPETTASRWARARTRAAKVGKGLSKSDKAQKLALQHWLEAIDPRHRYGHNLQFYYEVWFESESTQPFFYWLDVGYGKEFSLKKCPRSILQQQCIKYLGPFQRGAYEVTIKDGKLIYKLTELTVHTADDAKWIFVLSTSGALYVGQKKKGKFQHSSFLAGGATTAAGRLVVKDGFLKAIWPNSGHYLPTEENFKEFINFLEENNVDLTNVKTCSIDEDERSLDNSSSFKMFRSKDTMMTMEINEAEKDQMVVGNYIDQPPLIESNEPLAQKWSTGAGPRIGFMLEYSSDMQCQALEQVNLSVAAAPST